MNADTGATYSSLRDAIDAGEERDNLVEISGSPEQVARISQAVREANRRKNKAAPEGTEEQPMNHVFGEIVGDPEVGGVTKPEGCILLDEWTTLAVETIQQGEVAPAIFLRLTGRLLGSSDTIDATVLLPVMDAGNLAGALFAAAERIGGPSPSDFRLGLAVGAGEAK